MKYIRQIETKIDNFINPLNLQSPLTTKNDGKILFIWGPRRSGKTTILEGLAKKLNSQIYNFDLLNHKDKFVPDEKHLDIIAGENEIILIDEVQNSPESSKALKILVDLYKKKIIATGSSELRQKAGKDFDSLSDRFEEIYCLPISIGEIVKNNNNLLDNLDEKLQVFGSYPEILLGNLGENEKIQKLERIVDTYVVKDVVNIYNLKDSDLAKKILTKIALQIGNEVSLRELANSLNANVSTVSNYIEIFIKNYILISLPSFKTNIRKAVSENRKLYFYDLGIRNALIKDFREIELRSDSGNLWENLIIIEYEKVRKINNLLLSYYFYREYGGKEVDLIIEDYKKKYTCVEIKKSNGKINKIFPLSHKSKIITKENFIDEFLILEHLKDSV